MSKSRALKFFASQILFLNLVILLAAVIYDSMNGNFSLNEGNVRDNLAINLYVTIFSALPVLAGTVLTAYTRSKKYSTNLVSSIVIGILVGISIMLICVFAMNEGRITLERFVKDMFNPVFGPLFIVAEIFWVASTYQFSKTRSLVSNMR